jgi:hypothetical protein
MSDDDLVPRYQLECEGIIVQFETEAAMVHFIQHELPRELVENQEYETRTLH